MPSATARWTARAIADPCSERGPAKGTDRPVVGITITMASLAVPVPGTSASISAWVLASVAVMTAFTAAASVSVTSMKNAHLEEQKAIEKYWKRQEEKEKAKKQYEKETKDAAENADRRASLKGRDERVAKSKVARAARREQWSKSTAPEILQSLGEESLSGWVLLERI